MHVLLLAGEAAPLAGIQYSEKLHYMAARRPLLLHCCSPSDESSHKYSSSAPTLNKHKLEQFINWLYPGVHGQDKTEFGWGS